MAAVSSVEPSSTTITSNGPGSCAASAASTVPSVREALYAGMTTLTRGASATLLPHPGRQRGLVQVQRRGDPKARRQPALQIVGVQRHQGADLDLTGLHLGPGLAQPARV